MLPVGHGRYRGTFPTDVIKLPADNSAADILTLASGPGASGPITLTAPALVSVTATLQLFNIDAASVHGFGCQSELRPSGGAAVVLGTADETVATFAERTVSWTTALAVDPGTYDVGVKCSVAFRTTSGWVTSADVVAIAFAR